eukprot:m51a1_g1843 hypothetical protein (363) ;mRNA; r:573695-577516
MSTPEDDSTFASKRKIPGGLCSGTVLGAAVCKPLYPFDPIDNTFILPSCTISLARRSNDQLPLVALADNVDQLSQLAPAVCALQTRWTSNGLPIPGGSGSCTLLNGRQVVVTSACIAGIAEAQMATVDTRWDRNLNREHTWTPISGLALLHVCGIDPSGPVSIAVYRSSSIRVGPVIQPEETPDLQVGDIVAVIGYPCFVREDPVLEMIPKLSEDKRPQALFFTESLNTPIPGDRRCVSCGRITRCRQLDDATQAACCWRASRVPEVCSGGHEGSLLQPAVHGPDRVCGVVLLLLAALDAVLGADGAGGPRSCDASVQCDLLPTPAHRVEAADTAPAHSEEKAELQTDKGSGHAGDLVAVHE